MQGGSPCIPGDFVVALMCVDCSYMLCTAAFKIVTSPFPPLASPLCPLPYPTPYLTLSCFPTSSYPTLQTADSLRTRALQLVEVMSYLRQFSELDDNSAEFKRKLPPVFWEDGGLHEAAVRGGRAGDRLCAWSSQYQQC